MEQKFRIALNFGNLSFEIESHDKEWVEKKEKEYLEKVCIKKLSNLDSTENRDKKPKELLSPNLTINEFYRKYVKDNNITSRPDTAIFLIYYLQKISKRSEIKSGDVSDCFKDIQFTSWNTINYTDILNQNRRKGFLNYVNKNWSLTITGEDFVMNTLTNKGEDK